MTTITAPTQPTQPVPHVRARAHPVGDALSVAWRNILNLMRTPEVVVFATIQPVIFVLMFRYVFGGAINVPGYPYPYVDYLMPGIFVQTITFGAVTTAVGLASDLQLGVIDRFRSLPMARSAVLVGRTLADFCRNVAVILLMVLVGFIVGFRVHTNFISFVGAILLVMTFAYALSWGFAYLGLRVGDPEAAQAAAFPVLAPLVFASSAFVSTETMPGWLQAFANHQPVTIVINATRALCSGGPTWTWVWKSILWIVGIVVVFGVLAVRRYRRT